MSENPKFMNEVEKKVRDNFSKAFENALIEEGKDSNKDNDEDDEHEDEE